MMPSSPHSITMGTGESSTMPTAVFRLCGHWAMGPSGVAAQSNARTRSAISPLMIEKPELSGNFAPSITPQYRADITPQPLKRDIEQIVPKPQAEYYIG